MSSPRSLLLTAVLATGLLAVGVPGATASSSADQQGRDVAAEHRQAVVDFWTAERVRTATPRALKAEPPRTAQAKPSWAGGPGGHGGDDDGDATWTTTGSSWATDDVVKKTTGKVFFVLDGTTYVCSGSVVADSRADAAEDVVLTAGHCVHDGDGQTWASKWLFVPDYDSSPAAYSGSGTGWCDDTRFGCWVATGLVTTTGWADSADFNDDVGFAVVGTGTTDGDLSDTVGDHDIDFQTSSPTVNAYAFGYPHASPYDGTDLVYCAGGTIDDPYGYDARGLECDMTGGSSGGPWYLADSAGTAFDSFGRGTAISVNSYKYTGGRYKKYMFGPVFADAEQDAYTVANGGSAGGAVSTDLS